MTSKIVALVDGLGNLARFVLLPGQRHDSVGVAPLIAGIEIGALIGDKGFDNDRLRQELDARGAIAVIPPKANRKTAIPCDFHIYRWRHSSRISSATSSSIAGSQPDTTRQTKASPL